jgi:hypothetical protein
MVPGGGGDHNPRQLAGDRPRLRRRRHKDDVRRHLADGVAPARRRVGLTRRYGASRAASQASARG